MEQKVYILSTGRSGTTFVRNFFSKHYPELEISHQKEFSRFVNVLYNLPLSSYIKLHMFQIIMRYIRKEPTPQSSCDPLLSLALEHYLRRRKDRREKIILLTRDPLDFVTSFINWKNQTVRKRILHHLIPFWQPVGYLNGVPMMHWLSMHKYEKFAWVWNYKNQVFYELVKKRQGIVVKLEEFDQKGLHRIAQYLGLAMKDTHEYESVEKNPSTNSGFILDHMQKQRVYHITEEMRKKLNY